MNYFVYIMTNKRCGTLYIGVTNNIARRIFEHKHGVIKGFTHRYGLKTLVYVEVFEYLQNALQREKQLKQWNRIWKISLIESLNPGWSDLGETYLQ